MFENTQILFRSVIYV